MPNFRSARFLAATLPLLITLAGPAYSRPPTDDPTYGLPLPTRKPAPTVTASLQWIWAATTAGVQTVQARGTVTLATAPKRAEFFVTGDDAFTAFVNGHKVEFSVPVEQGWKTVHRCSVARWLHAGRNVVAVEGTNDGGAAGILAELTVNDKPVLSTDARWKVREAKPVSTAEWNLPTVDDSAWSAATALAPVGEGPWANQLNGWPGSEGAAWYMAHRTLPPVSLRFEAPDGGLSSLGLSGKAGAVIHAAPTGTSAGATPAVVLVDFGKEVAGRVLISGTPGAKVTVTTGETREECTHVEPALDNRGPWTLTLGEGSNPAATPYTAFRYARIVVAPSTTEVRLNQIVCDHKYYPVTYKGSFACSDPALTRLWYAAAYTAHLCMQEEIWDAPKRDRGLWCGDLQVTGATINDVFADHFLMERSIAKLRDEAQKGRPDSEPSSAEVNMLPGYSAAWFCELADYYRATGAVDFLRDQRQHIIGLLEFQKTDFDSRNLFVNPRKDWNFVDWAPDFVVDSPQSRIATDLFTVAGVREAVYLLRALGDTAHADKYAAWADTLTAAAETAFVDPTTQTFGDRLQTNVMAVYSGVATPAQRDAVYARILRADSPVWKAPNPQPGNLDAYPMSPYYGYFVLESLGRLGRRQDGLDLLRRYWLPMTARGTTTLWEKFDPALPNDFHALLDRMPYLSLCHGWSTGPTPYLDHYILGVRPTSPGYKTVEIAPFLGDLQWAEGDIPTPQGILNIRAEKAAGGKLVETVTLPDGIVARIGVPGNTVTVNGRKATVSRDAGGHGFVSVAHAGTYRLVGVGTN